MSGLVPAKPRCFQLTLAVSLAVTLGRNQPLKKERPPWTSELPLTEGQLRSKRDEFWETAPAFEGRKEIWDALRAAAETDDHTWAQAIVDGANITLPTGELCSASLTSSSEARRKRINTQVTQEIFSVLWFPYTFFKLNFNMIATIKTPLNLGLNIHIACGMAIKGLKLGANIFCVVMMSELNGMFINSKRNAWTIKGLLCFTLGMSEHCDV